MSEKTYTSNIPVVTPIETLPKQFVLVRTDMVTQFTDDEYQNCVDAVTAGKAVCVQYGSNQVQLATVDGGALCFNGCSLTENFQYVVSPTGGNHTITRTSAPIDDYVPRQYGTNEVHNLPTTITAFRTGDAILVDGPSGPANMSKDDLLEATAGKANRALGIIDWTSGGFVNKDTGAITVNPNYVHSDFIRISKGAKITTNVYVGGDAGYAIYDSSKLFLSGASGTWYQSDVKTIDVTDDDAYYIRLCNSVLSKTLDNVYVVIIDNSNGITMTAYLVSQTSDLAKVIADTDSRACGFAGFVKWISGSFVNASDGTLTINPNYYYTDYIKVENGDKITANVRYSGSAGYAVYDKDKNFLYGSTDIKDGESEFVFDISDADACYLRISNSIVQQPLSTKYVYIGAHSGYKTALDKITNEVNQKTDYGIYLVKTLLGVVDWIAGSFVDPANGKLIVNVNYHYTEYIPVSDGDVITTNVRYMGSSGYAVYDKDKNFLYGSTDIKDGTSTYNITINDADAKFIRLSHASATQPLSEKFVFVSGYSSIKIALGYITDKIEDIESSISSILNSGESFIPMNHSVNLNDKPIVCFICDDGVSQDDSVVQWLEDEGLVGNFALMGTTNYTGDAWKTKVAHYKEFAKRGHGILCHGVAGGCSVHTLYPGYNYPGFGLATDAELINSVVTTKKSFVELGLRDNAFVYFNSVFYTPHVRTLVGKYFDYAVGSDVNPPATDGVNTLDSDCTCLDRMGLDASGKTDLAKALIESNLGNRVLLLFGGHASNWNGLDGHSSAEDIKDLFKYVGDLVKVGLVSCMNFQDAVETFFGTMHRVATLKDNRLNFCEGELVRDNGNLEICTSQGTRQVTRLSVSGSASNGTFRFNLPHADTASYADITITYDMSIENVVEAIRDAKAWRYVTIVKESSSSLLLYFDYAKANESVTITNNTTSLSFSFTDIVAGVAPTFS